MNGSAENVSGGNTSIHISVSDESDAASRDKIQSFSVCSHSRLQDSNTVAPGTDSYDIGSQDEDISVADVVADVSQEVHGSNMECISAALLNVGSMPRFRHDRHSVSSVSSDTCASSINLGTCTGSDMMPSVVSISHSSEKLWSWPNRRERSGFDSQAVGVVRSSWSQENYFDDNDITCVDIDLDDDDDLASSVDVLHYRDTAVSGDPHTHSWMEGDIRRGDSLSTGKLRSWAPLKGDEVFAELFSSDSESSLDDNNYSFASTPPASDFRKKSAKLYGIGVAIDYDPSEDSSDADSHQLTNCCELESSPNSNDTVDDIVFPTSLFNDIPATRPYSKDVDRPSAARLAKRLYYLQGFRKSDISRHLTKKNSFSQLVGEEFLKFFDFGGDTLDVALRRFVRHLTPNTDPQDREQLLLHFAQRYHSCNSSQYKSADSQSSHYEKLWKVINIGTKTTLTEFIASVENMNDGENFTSDKLRELYEAILVSPLEFEIDDSGDGSVSSAIPSTTSSSNTVMAATQVKYAASNCNPLFQAPDTSNTAEFKKGYIMRKSCIDPDGRKTALGRRGWKMFYAALCDMTLYMYSDENSYKRSTHCSNVIHLHHSLATKAGDYVKKNHVFRLQTADMAQYLIQTSDTRECQEWIDTINFVAASYSAPCQFDATEQKRFQRPLLPASYTTLNLREQISHQEKMAAYFEHELLEHHKDPPEKGARSRLIQEYCKKESYLKSEVKRYKTYVRLLQYKLEAFAELEPSLAETAIGEVEEPEHESAAIITTPPTSFDIAAVPSDIGHQQGDVEMPSGLDTLLEM